MYDLFLSWQRHGDSGDKARATIRDLRGRKSKPRKSPQTAPRSMVIGGSDLPGITGGCEKNSERPKPQRHGDRGDKARAAISFLRGRKSQHRQSPQNEPRSMVIGGSDLPGITGGCEKISERPKPQRHGDRGDKARAEIRVLRERKSQHRQSPQHEPRSTVIGASDLPGIPGGCENNSEKPKPQRHGDRGDKARATISFLRERKSWYRDTRHRCMVIGGKD